MDALVERRTSWHSLSRLLTNQLTEGTCKRKVSDNETQPLKSYNSVIISPVLLKNLKKYIAYFPVFLSRTYQT